MGIAHLLDALERDANSEITRLRAEARAAADRIIADAAAAIEQRRGAVFVEEERRHQHEVEQALTLARRAARLAVLEARERLLDRVFAAARDALPAALAGSAYRGSLPASLAGALEAVGEGPVVIRCPVTLTGDLERLRPNDQVSVVADERAGNGFRVRSADGAVEVVDTLEDRLDRRRPVLARWILEQLGANA